MTRSKSCILLFHLIYRLSAHFVLLCTYVPLFAFYLLIIYRPFDVPSKEDFYHSNSISLAELTNFSENKMHCKSPCPLCKYGKVGRTHTLCRETPIDNFC